MCKSMQRHKYIQIKLISKHSNNASLEMIVPIIFNYLTYSIKGTIKSEIRKNSNKETNEMIN